MGLQSTSLKTSTIALVTQSNETHRQLSAICGGPEAVRVVPATSAHLSSNTAGVLVDADLTEGAIRDDLRALSVAARRRDLPVACVLDGAPADASFGEALKLAADCGATHFLTRPLEAAAVLEVFPQALSRQTPQSARPAAADAGVAAAQDVLSTLFETSREGGPLRFEDVVSQDAVILDALRVSGIRAWLRTVRQHHNRTYVHSLLVTGVSVAFAQSLGMGLADQKRVAHAALMHDIGKAFIPLAILEKPGKLTDAEMETVREHPKLGFEHLLAQGGVPQEVLDCVLHHHELLDGSGYPDGLVGDQIGDLVRIMTIADIFSALIERRAYKPALPATRAMEIMEEMTGQLDPDLLREFQAVARQA